MFKCYKNQIHNYVSNNFYYDLQNNILPVYGFKQKHVMLIATELEEK